MQLHSDARQSEYLKRDFADSRVIYTYTVHTKPGSERLTVVYIKYVVGPRLAGVYSGQCPRLKRFKFCVCMKAQCNKKY